MKAATLTLLLCTASIPAFALDTPLPGKSDPRCRQTEYDSQNIVAMTTYVNRMATVSFGSPSHPEQILRFISGDQNIIDGPKPGGDNGGSNTPLGNIIPLWSVHPGKTNMIIITVDGETEHTYQLMVTVKPPPGENSDDSDATYCLSFTYHQEEKQEQAKVQLATYKQRVQEHQQQIAEDRLATDPFYGPQNFKYIIMGDALVAPDLNGSSDNYNTTAFRFLGNRSIPSVEVVDTPSWCSTNPPPAEYLKAPGRPVRSEQKGDLVIAYQTAAHWRFRLGAGHVADEFNCGYNPVGINPGTGTTSPNVVREMRQASR